MKINGYNIPYNSQIDVNTLLQYKDDKYFGKNAKKFDLKRWLNDKNEFKMNVYFIPFGLGPRNCPGQSIAMREIYAVIAPLLYRYKFSIPNNIKYIPIGEMDWLMTDPQEIPLNIQIRK